MNITKEIIDEVVLNASKNNLLDIISQVDDAMNQIPEFKQNPLAYSIMAVSIAQGNIMATLKEVLYKLFADEE